MATYVYCCVGCNFRIRSRAVFEAATCPRCGDGLERDVGGQGVLSKETRDNGAVVKATDSFTNAKDLLASHKRAYREEKANGV